MVSPRKNVGGTEKAKGKALPKPRTRGDATHADATRSESPSSSLGLGPTPELPPYPSNNLDRKVPAFADNRSDLSGSLGYFQELRESVYEENGIIQGCLISDEAGFKAEHVGEHVVIVRCGWAADYFPAATEELAESRHQMKSAELRRKHDIFAATNRIEYPVALIIDSQCEHLPIHPLSVPGRYCVMDYFRISNIWPEPSMEADVLVDDMMVKFEKVNLQSGSWWFSPHMRDSSPVLPLPDPIHCLTCGQMSSFVYTTWVCLNQECQYYFCTADKVLIRVGLDDSATVDQLLPTFLPSYLGALRTWRVPMLQPAHFLTTPLQAQQMQHSTRGIVCTDCAKCIPRIHWVGWLCSGCGKLHPAGPIMNTLRVDDIVQRPAYAGHPAVNPQCPAEYNPILGIARDAYRVDRFTLHRNTTVILISPSQATNVQGADPIWTNVLAEANASTIPFRRTLLAPDAPEIGIRSEHFHATYGEKYDFSERLPTVAAELAPSIRAAIISYVRPLLKAELGPTFEEPNSIQALAYVGNDATLPWHTDGDEEVGSLISTLSLGGDAVMKIRMQKKYYDHDEFDPADVLVGSHNWRELRQLNADLTERRMNPETAAPLYQFYLGRSNEPRPEILLPLIHGSIVIIQGKEFTEFFEHEVVSKEALRFAITQRCINPNLHQVVEARLQGARQVGQKFINVRGLFTDLPGYVIDEYDIEVDDEEEAQTPDEQQLQPQLSVSDRLQSPVRPVLRKVQSPQVSPVRQIQMNPAHGNNFDPQPAQTAMVTRSSVAPRRSTRLSRNALVSPAAPAPARAPAPAHASTSASIPSAARPVRVRIRLSNRASPTPRGASGPWTAEQNNIIRRFASAQGADPNGSWTEAAKTAFRNAGLPVRSSGAMRTRWYHMQSLGSFGGVALEPE